MIELDGPEPLRVQIAEHLRGRITSGEITNRLPTMAQLGEEYGVSRRTVNDALRILREDGTIVGTRGRGTFVRRAE